MHLSHGFKATGTDTKWYTGTYPSMLVGRFNYREVMIMWDIMVETNVLRVCTRLGNTIIKFDLFDTSKYDL